jgi:hypothetical protein
MVVADREASRTVVPRPTDRCVTVLRAVAGAGFHLTSLTGPLVTTVIERGTGENFWVTVIGSDGVTALDIATVVVRPDAAGAPSFTRGPVCLLPHQYLRSADRAEATASRLSGGQRRRLDVAMALIGDPELIFLDEPTTGFDPSARRAAWEMISGLRSAGVTVFLTTH